jgi:hypothetical protein
MNDPTSNETPSTQPSSQLSPEDQRKLEALTAPKGERYRADTQNQRGLERLRAWTRALFKREDHRRWRDSKTKILGFIVVGAALFAFWNYYPRPQLSGAVYTPGLSIGSSGEASPNASSATALPRPAQQPDSLEAAPPPKLPVARIASNPSGLPVASAPVPVTNSSDPFTASEATSASVDAPRASLARSPDFAGFATPLETNAAGLPSFPTASRQSVTPPRVASAPVIIVQKPFVSSQIPKPLFERRSESLPLELKRDQSATNEAPSAASGNLAESAVTSASARVAEPTPFNIARDGQDIPGFGNAGTLVNANAAQTTSATGDAQPSGVLFDSARNTPTPASNSAVPSSQTPAAFQPGARVGAKLSVGVIVVQGQESPVAAQLEGGAFAFGKASLNGSRVQIVLSQVVEKNVSSGINASALGADGFPGVNANLREDSPDVVSKLWQAGLQGVSSYAGSVIQGATTTIANGATSVAGPQPNLGLSLLQSLAQTFLAPANQQVVKYAQLEPGTPFQVLFLPVQ